MESVPPRAAPGGASERPAPADPAVPPRRDARAEEPLPRRFGRYQLFDRIGRGGMADIFLALARTELGAERLVVLKQILAPLSGDPGFAKMFVEEAKLCAGLRHANVVQVIDLGREEGLLYMAMEYVEGFDLHQLLLRCSRAKVPLPPELAIFVVREVLAALDFAHRATGAGGAPLGIVHRDVSPSNVLISLEGEVKLCDFGIARAAGAAGEASGARVVGKSAYMSPEHARGEELDARADVFAAGILLWELCAGRRLYRGSEEEMLALAKRGEVPPLPDRGLPEHARLAALLERALAPDRAARFASAAEMLRALDDYAHASRLFASQIRFGQWVTDHFAEQFVAERRARERAARALALGPPVRMEPIGRSQRETRAIREPAAPDPEPTPEQVGAEPLSDVSTDKSIRVFEDDTQPEAEPLPASMRVPPKPAPAPAPARTSTPARVPSAAPAPARIPLVPALLAVTAIAIVAALVVALAVLR